MSIPEAPYGWVKNLDVNANHHIHSSVQSGFTKLDLSGFTLKEILDIVKKIADDVEVILNAPQKETVSNFEATITMIKHDANEEAYDKLKLVNEIGTRAIVYADRKITLQIFEETMKVVHILIRDGQLVFSKASILLK